MGLFGSWPERGRRNKRGLNDCLKGHLGLDPRELQRFDECSPGG